MNAKPRHVIFGFAAMLALSLGAIALSLGPSWQSLPPDQAMLRLSIRHGGKRDCRTPTAAEQAQKAANMRTRQICERRRAPILVEMTVDGARALDREVPPSGLWGTGPSRLYLKLPIVAGKHRITLRLADDPRNTDNAFTLEREIAFRAGQNVAIDFNAEEGGFIVVQ